MTQGAPKSRVFLAIGGVGRIKDKGMKRGPIKLRLKRLEACWEVDDGGVVANSSQADFDYYMY